jgi:hypothetical protein
VNVAGLNPDVVGVDAPDGGWNAYPGRIAGSDGCEGREGRVKGDDSRCCVLDDEGACDKGEVCVGGERAFMVGSPRSQEPVEELPRLCSFWTFGIGRAFEEARGGVDDMFAKDLSCSRVQAVA